MKKARKENQLLLNQECLLKDHQDWKDQQVLLVPLACKAHLAHLETLVREVHLVVLDYRVLMDYLDLPALC